VHDHLDQDLHGETSVLATGEEAFRIKHRYHKPLSDVEIKEKQRKHRDEEADAITMGVGTGAAFRNPEIPVQEVGAFIEKSQHAKDGKGPNSFVQQKEITVPPPGESSAVETVNVLSEGDDDEPSDGTHQKTVASNGFSMDFKPGKTKKYIPASLAEEPVDDHLDDEFLWEKEDDGFWSHPVPNPTHEDAAAAALAEESTTTTSRARHSNRGRGGANEGEETDAIGDDDDEDRDQADQDIDDEDADADTGEDGEKLMSNDEWAEEMGRIEEEARKYDASIRAHDFFRISFGDLRARFCGGSYSGDAGIILITFVQAIVTVATLLAKSSDWGGGPNGDHLASWGNLCWWLALRVTFSWCVWAMIILQAICMMISALSIVLYWIYLPIRPLRVAGSLSIVLALIIDIAIIVCMTSTMDWRSAFRFLGLGMWDMFHINKFEIGSTLFGVVVYMLVCLVLTIATLARSKSSLEGVARAIAAEDQMVADIPSSRVDDKGIGKGKGKPSMQGYDSPPPFDFTAGGNIMGYADYGGDSDTSRMDPFLNTEEVLQNMAGISNGPMIDGDDSDFAQFGFNPAAGDGGFGMGGGFNFLGGPPGGDGMPPPPAY